MASPPLSLPSLLSHPSHPSHTHHHQSFAAVFYQLTNPPTHQPTTMAHHALFGIITPRWEFSVDAWKDAQGLHTVRALHEMTAESLEGYLRDKIFEDLELYGHTSMPRSCLCVAFFGMLTCPFVVLVPLPRPTRRFLPPSFVQVTSNPRPSRTM